MNFAIVLEHWRILAQGTLTTILLLSVVGTVAPLLAIPLALARDSGRILLAWPVAALSWFTRAVPTLVLLFFAYYGLPVLGIYLEPVPAALLALVTSAIGYNTEFFRAGFRSVPHGQLEAARALGLHRWTILRRVVLPQALRVAVPPVFSNLTLNLKGTALASLVSVSELTSKAQGLLSETYRAVEFLLAAGLIYLVLNSLLIALQAWVERRLDRPYRAATTKRRSSNPIGMRASA